MKLRGNGFKLDSYSKHKISCTIREEFRNLRLIKHIFDGFYFACAHENCISDEIKKFLPKQE